MGRALLILLTAAVIDVVEEKMSSLSVSSGSSSTLPTSCTFDPSNNYELYVGEQMIGSYMNHHLISRLQFSERLQFDQENCSFILKNLTEGDSNIYTFITKYQEKGKIVVDREELFNVTVTGPETDKSLVNHSSKHYEDSIYGSLAVCFLLDTPVAMLLMGIHLLLLWLVKKCTKKFPEVRPSCLHHVFEFILGVPVQKAAISGFKFGEYFSLVFQLVATALFIVWNNYGQGHGAGIVWPILSAISFLVEMVMTCCRCDCTCLPEKLTSCHLFVTLLRPLLISGSIVVAFSLTYYDITVIRKMWYLVAVLISLSIRVVLMFFFYWKQKSRNETNNNNKTDPKSLLGPQEPPPART